MRAGQYLSGSLGYFVGFLAGDVAFLGGVEALFGLFYRERTPAFHGFLYGVRVAVAYVGRAVPVYGGAYDAFLWFKQRSNPYRISAIRNFQNRSRSIRIMRKCS